MARVKPAMRHTNATIKAAPLRAQGPVHLVRRLGRRRRAVDTLCGKHGEPAKNFKHEYTEKGKPNFRAVSIREVRSDLLYCKACTGTLVHKYKR